MEVNEKSVSPTKKFDVSPTTTARKTFPYPALWKDDVRMKVLFAPFRPRDVNPLNYDSKMKFWQELIADYCQHKGSAVFCQEELQTVFRREQQTPHCFDTVFAELQHSKKIRPQHDYEYDPCNSWTGWAMTSFVKRPLNWSWQKVKASIGAHVMPPEQIQYVHLDVMKNFCNVLLAEVLEQQQQRSALLHYDEFKTIVMDCMTITDECLQLCLHTLHLHHKIGLEYKLNEHGRHLHLIKIPTKTDSSIVFNETDHAIHNLQMTQKSLLKELEALEEEIQLNNGKTRQYLKENKRQLAKTHLRKTRLLGKNFEKRSSALHNIETLLDSVHEAQSNGDILDALKIGSKALQQALNESGLKYDNVDEIIADVRDTIEMHNEIEDTMANGMLNDETLAPNELDELETELRAIVGEDGVRTPNATNPAFNKPIPTTATAAALPTITITDEELLAMLDSLEVADTTMSPAKSTSANVAF